MKRLWGVTRQVKTLLPIVFVLFAVALQHLVHEFAHVCAARLFGVKVTRVQWLTYRGGTRVFYENEPDFTASAPKKWAVIAGAGYIATNGLAYILTGVYACLPQGWVKAFAAVLCVVFLLGDGAYFVLGSIFDFGDIVGVRNTLKLPKQLSVALAVGVLAINAAIGKTVFY